MISFFTAIGLFWTCWFWMEIPMLVNTHPDAEGLWVYIWTFTAVTHICWLGWWWGRHP